MIDRDCLSLGVEDLENALVHAEHDGGRGNGPHEVRSQAAVQADEALFLPDQLEAVYEARVLGLSVGHRCLP